MFILFLPLQVGGGWGGGDLENEIGGEGREKYEERRECKYKFQINYIEQVNSINLRKP